MENIIEIRSNINATIIELQRIEAEREAREKAEREERWKREAEEREQMRKNFEVDHPNMAAYTYASYYNINTFNYDYGGYCKIHFYEWSNPDSEPIIFERYTRLYNFLDECGLMLSKEDNDKIKPVASCYICCKPGCKDLVVCTTHHELKDKIEEAKTLVNILSTVPDIDEAS